MIKENDCPAPGFCLCAASRPLFKTVENIGAAFTFRKGGFYAPRERRNQLGYSWIIALTREKD